VNGDTALASSRTVTVDAANVPASQDVEADVTFPARLVSGGDVNMEPSPGLAASAAPSAAAEEAAAEEAEPGER